MSNQCTHAEYYRQFITPKIEARVLMVITPARLLASRDPYFNDIPLAKWDAVWFGGCPADLGAAMRAAGDFPTMAGLVCVAKQAARQWMESNQTAVCA
jgi:hypothetical protein